MNSSNSESSSMTRIVNELACGVAKHREYGAATPCAQWWLAAWPPKATTSSSPVRRTGRRATSTPGLRHEQPADQTSHLSRIERLREEGRAARLEEAPLVGVQHVPGDKDDPLSERRETSLELAVELHTVHDWHLRVRHDEIVPMPFEFTQRLRSVGHDLDRMPVAPERFGQDLRELALVVDDEDRFRSHRGRSLRRVGRTGTRRPRDHGQCDRERRALPGLAHHGDGPAVLLDDSPAE